MNHAFTVRECHLFVVPGFGGFWLSFVVERFQLPSQDDAQQRRKAAAQSGTATAPSVLEVTNPLAILKTPA
jgi:hypothetical protein